MEEHDHNQVKERLLLEDKTFILPMKSFYKDATELPKVNHPEYNFDHPDAFESESSFFAANIG